MLYLEKHNLLFELICISSLVILLTKKKKKKKTLPYHF
jgi:hypothetical protein